MEFCVSTFLVHVLTSSSYFIFSLGSAAEVFYSHSTVSSNKMARFFSILDTTRSGRSVVFTIGNTNLDSKLAETIHNSSSLVFYFRIITCRRISIFSFFLKIYVLPHFFVGSPPLLISGIFSSKYFLL